MNATPLQSMSDGALIERFTEIALDQDESLLEDDTARFNELYRQMDDVENELKSRGGDKRRMLTQLYSHPNAQVRLTAAMATLALAPRDARRVLELIQEFQEHPQALDASMTLRNLDRGIFIPT
jgi:hypothetical protein